MEKNTRRVVLLFSLILVAVPMVVFPNRMGLGLGSGSAVILLYEMVYYGLVLFLFRRDTTLAALSVGVALTLVYRLVLGAALGLALVVMYDISFSVAFSLGMIKYLPAILLQAVGAPFVLRAVYLDLSASLAPGRKGRASRRMPAATIIETTAGNAAAAPVRETIPTARPEHASSAPPVEGSQFDRAVAYLGGSGAVRMALLVDQEGLSLAKFIRGGEDVEAWAPLAVMVLNQNRGLVARVDERDNPDKVDIVTKGVRLLVRRIDRVILLVVAEPNIDETIHIRIAQAADMVRKYMSERYSPAMFARVEDRYVSHS
jgi:predicted regulator of Ras-like GTPase activity (Roadblock/LC7/MglB family)